MSVLTDFKDIILTERKQGKRNKFSYSISNSETLLYSFFKNRLFSHMKSLIMSFLVLCINSESLNTSFAQKTRRPSVNGED
jgi:hypothetical protein